MSKKHVLLLTGILMLVLLGANLWTFLTRDWESSFYPASYATLYYPTDIPSIRKWKVINRKELKIYISIYPPVKKWRVLCDGNEHQVVTGMNPCFKIHDSEQQLHHYEFIPLPEGSATSLNMTVQYYPKEFYHKMGLQHNDVYIVKPAVPLGDFKQFSVNDWVDSYDYVGQVDLAEVDKLLLYQAGINQNDSTISKIEKLTKFLRRQLINARGVPKDDERWMNPYRLYKEMVAGTAKGWCTQHAQLYVFFANRAGIPTRLLLGARTEGNSIFFTGHTWAESYLKEQQCWAFVDLSHGIICVTDKQGKVFNTLELMFLNQHETFDNIFARIYKDWEYQNLPFESDADSLTTVPFVACNQVVKQEFIPHAIIKFRRPPNVEDVRYIYDGFFKDKTFLWANLERYLFKPPLAYSFYPTEGMRTYLLRQSLFYGFLGVLLLFIFAALKKQK